MGKIVKYCADCEEGFAEKFSFCPNCASPLTAYEMNPANTNEVLKVAEPVPVEEPKEIPAEKVEAAPIVEPPVSEPVTQNFSVKDDEIDLMNDEDFISDEKPVAASQPKEKKHEIIAPAAAIPKVPAQDFSVADAQPEYVAPENTVAEKAANENIVNFSERANDSNANYPPLVKTNTMKAQDGLYHITFVEEKNASGRNLLLLGAFMLVTATVLGGVLYSLFAQNPYIGSLNDNDVLVAYTDETAPEPAETKPPPPKKTGDQGGGGGGGKENPEPVSKGRPPSQVDKPIMPPQPLPVLTNPTLANPNETQGKNKHEKTDEPVGSLIGGLNPSSGSGSGGGMGSGRGTGAGSGIGTGNGSGIGSGEGGGRGNGTGDGTGDDGGPPSLPPRAPVVEDLKILSKPKATYTDPARQNQVTGVVRVRVTFLPSGSIGSVTPLNSLPYGLTEQAIAAAKQIRFEPKKANGVPVAVTKVFEYTFNIF